MNFYDAITPGIATDYNNYVDEYDSEAWVNHSNTVLAHRAIEEERDQEEWLDENFGNECLNCGGPLGHSHTC